MSGPFFQNFWNPPSTPTHTWKNVRMSGQFFKISLPPPPGHFMISLYKTETLWDKCPFFQNHQYPLLLEKMSAGHLFWMIPYNNDSRGFEPTLIFHLILIFFHIERYWRWNNIRKRYVYSTPWHSQVICLLDTFSSISIRTFRKRKEHYQQQCSV